jgi:hypothetical protein
VDFSGHDVTGDGGAAGGVIGSAKLDATEGDAGIGHPGHAGLEASPVGQVVDCGALFPTEGESGGSDADGVAENAEGFEEVDGEGEFFDAGGLFLGAFFWRELGRVKGNFDLEGEVVASDEGARSGQVEGVLDDFGHGRGNG